MLPSFPHPSHMPCPDCGASVAVGERDTHTCDDERWVEYQLFQLRDEVDALEPQIAAYLDSPDGRFRLWLAARDR
ncbi:MAG TPA: hypothetical protein VIA10_05360 [Gaiellaceae bacterium]